MNVPIKWEFPGGKVEFGESIEACLKREIKEDLGVEIDLIEQLPSNIHQDSNSKIELIPFRCSLHTLEIDLREHLRVQRLSKNKLGNLDWADADLPIVSHYLHNYK